MEGFKRGGGEIYLRELSTIHFKSYIMKKYAALLLFFPIILFSYSFAQQKAPLEVEGGTTRTVGLFGATQAGISLQNQYPAVGFNHYFNPGGKYISDGYAASLWFSPYSGSLNVDLFPSGVAENGASGIRGFTITNAGKIGIGTSTANADLQFRNVLDNRKIILFESSNDEHGYYGFGINQNALRYQVSNTAGSHLFYAGINSGSSQFLMRIGGNKKVYIGEQNAGFRLGINSYDPAYTLELVQTDNRGIILVNPVLGYKNWELVSGDYDGTDVSLTLYHNESTFPKGWFRPDTGGYTSTSDRRLKENIRSLDSVLKKVMLLRPSMYNFIENDAKRHQIGFIAQEVESIFPTVVDSIRGKNPGDPVVKGIDYGSLSVIAIKAIQELQQEIESLKKEIEILKKTRVD